MRNRISLAIFFGVCLALGAFVITSAQTTINNTAAQLAGKTLDTLEDAQIITGLKTFSRGTNAPFAVVSGGAKVTYLDVDTLDGLDSTYFLNASNLNAGTVPDARFPATLPAMNGAALTGLNANNLASGTVATARLGASGTVNSTTFLRGDNTWAQVGTNQLSATGTPSNTTYLRGDNSWATVTSSCVYTQTTKSATYSAAIGDRIAASGTFVVTLPLSSTATSTSCGIIVMNIGSGTITIARTNAGSDSVIGNQGETSQTLNPGDAAGFFADVNLGTAWRIY